MNRLAATTLVAGVALCGVGWALTSMGIDALLEHRGEQLLLPARIDRGEAWPTGHGGW